MLKSDIMKKEKRHGKEYMMFFSTNTSYIGKGDRQNQNGY